MIKVVNTYEDILELNALGEFLNLEEAQKELILCVTVNRFNVGYKQAELFYDKAYKSKNYLGLADVLYYIEELADLYVELNKCA